FVAGCLWLAERRPRRRTLVGLGVAHLAVLALVLPLVVPILPTRQLVSTGTWDKSFWKDELGWHELVAQTARAWSSRTPAERAGGRSCGAGCVRRSAGSGSRSLRPLSCDCGYWASASSAVPAPASTMPRY